MWNLHKSAAAKFIQKPRGTHMNYANTFTGVGTENAWIAAALQKNTL